MRGLTLDCVPHKAHCHNAKVDVPVAAVFGNSNAFLKREKEAHMKPINRTAVCTVFFLAALGAAFAQQVSTDFDHQANFAQYKT